MTVKADPARTAYVRLAELAAEARHASERYRLYRARAYGPHATSTWRLRELERHSELAGSRLDRARAELEAHPPS